MAPKDTPKVTQKIKSVVDRTSTTKSRSSPVTLKKTITIKKSNDTKFTKANVESRQRTMTVPKVSTPKIKDKKSTPMPGSVTKSAKKATWKRRPKPAHSGVPVPEKMKKLLQKQFMESQLVDSD